MIGLSICIPVYNFNCLPSIKTLCKQIDSLSINAEILVIDDSSNINLETLANFKHTHYKYQKLEANIGRSKIRNLLGLTAKFSHLLFIDGDSGIPKNYLQNYVTSVKQNLNSVICGGRVHKLIKNSKICLRYNYGLQYEDIKASKRILSAHCAFMSNNFVIPKKIFRDIPFNETLSKYGHEDTFFGFELAKHKVEVIHIDNPVTHLELETNSIFIEKTKQAIKNLIYLNNKYPGFGKHTKLLRIANTYKFTKKLAPYLSEKFELLAVKTNNALSFQLFKLFYIISKNKQE